MPRIQVSLNDKLAQELTIRASELGLELDEFLAQAIQQNADKLTRPKMWMPRQALVRVFKPVKMNYQILGNSGPHLHCILQPRFYGDSEPGWPIDPYKEQVVLTPEEYKERIRLIRAALGE